MNKTTYELVDIDLSEQEKIQLIKIFLRKNLNNISYELFEEKLLTEHIEIALFLAIYNQSVNDAINMAINMENNKDGFSI